MNNKKLFIKFILFLFLFSNLSCSRNLNPSTMKIEDYKNVDFRDIVEGKVKIREEYDTSNVEILNDREAKINEIKVPVYIYDNDTFQEARYQYFIKGEDYRGYPYSNNIIDTSLDYDNLDTGIGNTPIIIGMYTSSSFTQLIDPNILSNVNENLNECHVRRVSSKYIYSCYYIGEFGDFDKININYSYCEFNYEGKKYKANGRFDLNPYFILEELYIDGEKQNIEEYNFTLARYGKGIYHCVLIKLDYITNGEINNIIPQKIYCKNSPYTVFA